MKCTAYGHDNPKNAQFCGKCGVSLSTSETSGIGTASPELPMASFPKTKKTNPRRRIKPWMWIVSGVVGLSVILFVLFCRDSDCFWIPVCG